jgi:hypothetical protein
MDDRRFLVGIEISVRETFYGQFGVSPSNASFQQSTASSVRRFLKVFSHLHLHLARTYMERIDREELPHLYGFPSFLLLRNTVQRTVDLI